MDTTGGSSRGGAYSYCHEFPPRQPRVVSIERRQDTTRYTHADTLRGSNGPARACGCAVLRSTHARESARLQHQRLERHHLSVLQSGRARCRSISRFRWKSTSMVQDRRKLTYRRDGNAFSSLSRPSNAPARCARSPCVSRQTARRRRLPWDADSRPTTASPLWIATPNEGLGASVWWPNKTTCRRAGQPAIGHHHTRSLIDVSNGRYGVQEESRTVPRRTNVRHDRSITQRDDQCRRVHAFQRHLNGEADD